MFFPVKQIFIEGWITVSAAVMILNENNRLQCEPWKWQSQCEDQQTIRKEMLTMSEVQFEQAEIQSVTSFLLLAVCVDCLRGLCRSSWCLLRLVQTTEWSDQILSWSFPHDQSQQRPDCWMCANEIVSKVPVLWGVLRIIFFVVGSTQGVLEGETMNMSRTLVVCWAVPPRGAVPACSLPGNKPQIHPLIDLQLWFTKLLAILF